MARLTTRLASIRHKLSERRATVVTLLVTALAAVAIGLFLTAQSGTYPLNAVFSSAQGLFPGAAVRLLGVRIGTVTDVQYRNGAVYVRMEINGGQSLPQRVDAALEAPLLLGTPDIDLSPGYTGGPTLGAGATIPESRTATPVSTDQLLHQMQRVLGALKPSSVHSLVANLANDIAGQGGEINQLIQGASGTLKLLAARGTDLGKMNGSLAQLTSTLDQHESKLLNLVQAYDTVSQVISSHQSALGTAIDELSTMSAQLVNLVNPNMKPLRQDIAVITTFGRTLDRNLANLDELLSSSKALFAGAHHSYAPQYHWINLNNQLAPGLTTSFLEGLMRDRLAGICRRVLAHHSSGLSSAQKQVLAQCGNPDSGYFNPILGLIPKILAGQPVGNGSSSSLSSALGAGLSKIPGLSASERQQISKAASQASQAGSQSSSSSKPHKKCKPGIDGAIDCILGPLPPVSGPASGLGGSSGPTGLLGAAAAAFHLSWGIRW